MYIFNLFLKTISLFSKRFFQKTLPFCMISTQEQFYNFIFRSHRWLNFRRFHHYWTCIRSCTFGDILQDVSSFRILYGYQFLRISNTCTFILDCTSIRYTRVHQYMVSFYLLFVFASLTFVTLAKNRARKYLILFLFCGG